MVATNESDLFQQRKPYFIFPEVPATAALTFEKLSLQHVEIFYRLFENDVCRFVDARFKSYTAAKSYVDDLIRYGAYSPKHGGQDWLFKWHDTYAGVMHLYDMSLETFAQNNERAWVGIALQEQFRGRGIAFTAFRYFTDYIFRFYPDIHFIHAMTEKENKRSQTLLMRCGFIPDPAERLAKYNFYVLQRSKSTRA